MREGLAGLTLRGRAFIAAGVSAVVCAIVLGQPTMTRVGLLLIALPLLMSYLVGRARYRFALSRTVTPKSVPAGTVATVEVDLLNEGRTPIGVLLLEEQLPYVLGNRPRFVLEGIGKGWRRHLHYQLRSDVRGDFEIGPMRVWVSDPFGMVELGRSFTTTVSLTVTPKVIALPPVPLSGELSGSGENRPRSFASGSAEDVTVREYRRGDDLRRVHWRSSARVGELMVRREEQPWQSRATIYLDNRRGAHRGHGLASSVETAITAAASIAVHLTQRGYVVRLVTASGEESAHGWHERSGPLSAAPLLHELAVLEVTNQPYLDRTWSVDGGRMGLSIGVFGGLLEPDLAVLHALGRHSASALALHLDVDAWAGALTTVRPPALAGWRSARLGPRDPLAEVWEQVARSAASNRAVAG